jgi:hypothetical protein
VEFLTHCDACISLLLCQLHMCKEASGHGQQSIVRPSLKLVHSMHLLWTNYSSQLDCILLKTSLNRVYIYIKLMFQHFKNIHSYSVTRIQQLYICNKAKIIY